MSAPALDVVLRRFATVALLAVAAGCTLGPSGPPSSGPQNTGQASPTATRPASGPAAPTAPIASSGTIRRQFTTPLLEVRSTGTHLIWSTGARADPNGDLAPDLYAAEPGGTPSVVYDNPNRDSQLSFLDGADTRIAFIETNERLLGVGGWKLWYLASLDGKAIVVDAGTGSELPTFAISRDHLVWATVEVEPAESQLLDLDLGSMDRRVLVSAGPDHKQFWYPDVDGDRVVYGTVEPQADLSEDQRHVYLLDLTVKGPGARLDHSQSASEPAIHGNDIVWKESDQRFNFKIAGQLVHYRIDSGTQEALDMPAEGDLGFVEPTIGNRFATAWPQSDRKLYLADLVNGTFPPILDLGSTDDDPHDAVALPDISGNLLAYVFAPRRGDLELRWVVLQP